MRWRTTVQQAHTNEWLGSFGAAGNGDIWGELQQACEVIKIYLQFHKLNLEIGLLRLDGAYGWARGAYICQQNSLRISWVGHRFGQSSIR